MQRRHFVAALSSWLAVSLRGARAHAATTVHYANVLPYVPLKFPRDFGSHPQFRTEWWYITGWLNTASGEPLGFQVTFFRSRPDSDAELNPSEFAARQLLIAHCAISDPRRGRLWQDQRIRRAGLGLAQSDESDTRVWIDNWILERQGQGYRARLDADGFALHLDLSTTQPTLLNGAAGYSRKAPDAVSASYYYSEPHISVNGDIERGTRRDIVTGEAWLDHEWSSEYLDTVAVGWEWTGINLADGGALMVFRMRAADGGQRWAGGTYRRADGKSITLQPEQIAFHPIRSWVSPRTGIAYPVAWQITAGPLMLRLEPLLDDQENDTRLSTGAIYWEGAVRAYDAQRQVGAGYLELTGYGERLRLR